MVFETSRIRTTATSGSSDNSIALFGVLTVNVISKTFSSSAFSITFPIETPSLFSSSTYPPSSTICLVSTAADVCFNDTTDKTIIIASINLRNFFIILPPFFSFVFV